MPGAAAVMEVGSGVATVVQRVQMIAEFSVTSPIFIPEAWNGEEEATFDRAKMRKSGSFMIFTIQLLGRCPLDGALEDAVEGIGERSDWKG